MIEERNKNDFNEYIESLLVDYESDDLEFKSAAGGFPKTFWDTYSAFANSEGGMIVLGVAEKKNYFYLDGLTEEQILKYQKDFWNNVNNKSTISCNLLTSKDVEIIEYKGYHILLFHIPRANREQRPVYRTTNPFGNTFKRNFEGDYRCTDTEVKRMFADADEAHPIDGRILKNYTIEDIDKNALNRYRQLFKLSSPDHPWLALEDVELLRMLGGYRKDRQSGEEGFTVAGLLMFGKTLSITDEECCPYFFPDYQERLAEDEDVRWSNRICADGTWEANLFNFYQRVLPRLQSVLPKPFQLNNNIRIEETPAHIAVREALINFCIHADYTINASMVIRHQRDSFVFSNPGTLLISKEQYYTGGDSVCRNKYLQKMFSMIGVAEKAGSGTDKIMKGWREANWRSPKIDEQLQPDKVVLVMPMESLLSEKAKATLSDKFGITANSFNHDVISVLALACDEGDVTNERLRYVLNMHKAEISELLKLMVQKELLEAYGYGRGMHYKLPAKKINVFELDTPTPDDSTINQDTCSATNNTSSEANSASNSASSEANSASNSASSEANSASSDNNNASNRKKRNRKKRLSREELKTLIISICADWVSIEEIVERSGKSVSYIRNVVIPLLIAEKVIVMMYPGTPRNPNQKYRIKE